MAINFIKKDDLSHITRTTRQWETTIDRYEIIPKGVLCIELCNDKLTKIKIGNGHLIYEQLPYVSGVDLSDYYTKEETNNLIKDLKSIKIKGEASSLSDLPLRGNEEGDLWFIKKQSPDDNDRYDEYVWYKNKWESFGSSDIDLSEYAKKSYVDTHIQEVQNEITEIIESGYLHKHNNKNVLDQTSAVYTAEKDNKLRDLHNYDDTELRNKAHTHSNKNILDQTDAVYNRDKDEKLSSLHNYDDSDIQNRLSDVESVAHQHENKSILDRTTAAFTREQAIQLLDCKDFEGTDGTHPGVHGFVPAPTAADVGKVLGANGQWVEGGGGGSGDVIAQGDGIEITTDSQTGVKTISVDIGDGLQINQDGELEIDPSIIPEVPEYYSGEAIDIISTHTTDKLRIEITGIRSTSQSGGSYAPYCQMLDIEFSDENDNVISLSSGTGIWSDGTSVEYPNPGESIDGMIAAMLAHTGKMIATKFNGTKSLLLTFDLTTPVSSSDIQKFRYKTGDDVPNRDPISWKIYKHDSITGWILINETTSASITTTRSTWTQYFTLESTDSSNSYSINVKHGDGLTINQDNEVTVATGYGLQFDQNGAVEVNTSIIPDPYDAGNGIQISQTAHTD